MESIHSYGLGCRTNLVPISIVLTILILSVYFSAGTSYSFDEPTFELGVRKVYSYPGQQHRLLPVLLANSDLVGQWDILVEYDYTGGSVVDVQLCDSLQAVDPAGDTLVWYYAPWYQDLEERPEYFDYILNASGYENRVRIVGIMDMDWPPDSTPPITAGEQQLLFGFVFHVYPLWDGHNIKFIFHTDKCENNTLANPTGSTVWGPDTLSASPSTCPERPDSLRVIRLTSGPGIGLGEITCGDINCDGIPGEIGDVVMFVNYLVYQYSECENIGCDTAWLECATPQSDMNGDAYLWTISDFVAYLHYMEYGGPLCDTIQPVFSDVDTMRISDSSSSPGDTLSVSINLQNTFPVYGYAFRIVYDSTLLTAIGPNAGEGWLVGSGSPSEPPLIPGSSSLTELIFVVDSNATPSTITYLTFEDDTVMAQFYNSLSDSIGTHVVPKLIPGTLRIVPTHVHDRQKLSHSLEVMLVQSFPNPFRTRTAIRYQLHHPDFVILEIYNCYGNLTRTLVNCRQRKGVYSVVWDGKDTSGKYVPTGTYFYRLKAGSHVITKKIIVMR